MQNKDNVIIKGVREGLLFILDDNVPFSEILTGLSERIGARPDFFKGASITLNTGRRIIDRPEFDVLYDMLTRHDMRVAGFVSLSAQSRMVAESSGVASRPPSFAANHAGDSLGLQGRGLVVGNASPAAEHEDAGVFMRSNLEQGQSVRYDGNVCVLGDVKAGAGVVAGGDIVVWGALRGTAHAGANGNEAAVVCALLMSPTQLNIAGYAITFPIGEREASLSEAQRPQLARVLMGQIIVEAWNEGN